MTPNALFASRRFRVEKDISPLSRHVYELNMEGINSSENTEVEIPLLH